MVTINNGFTKNKKSGSFTIAVIAKAIEAPAKSVITSLKETLESQAPGMFTVVVLNANNDEAKLANMTTSVMKSHLLPYDAIVPIGFGATETALRLSIYLGVKIPLFFLAPSFNNQSEVMHPQRNHYYVTGIRVSDISAEENVQVLQSVRKDLKKALILFDPSSARLYPQVYDLSQQLRRLSINFDLVPIKDSENVNDKVTPHLVNTDTILVTRNHAAMKNMESLGSICSQYGITLCGPHSDATHHGASIGYGILDSPGGVELARYLLSVFMDQAQPADLPIKTSAPSNFFSYNHTALSNQGISLSPEELESIKNRYIKKELLI
jgi:ABC-type uncharacterized transport system substrate-binding protein